MAGEWFSIALNAPLIAYHVHRSAPGAGLSIQDIMDVFPDTWRDPWCLGRGCMIPPRLWTQTPWTSVRGRDGSNWHSTCSASSTICMGKWIEWFGEFRQWGSLFQNDLFPNHYHGIRQKSEFGAVSKFIRMSPWYRTGHIYRTQGQGTVPENIKFVFDSETGDTLINKLIVWLCIVLHYIGRSTGKGFMDLDIPPPCSRYVFLSNPRNSFHDQFFESRHMFFPC